VWCEKEFQCKFEYEIIFLSFLFVTAHSAAQSIPSAEDTIAAQRRQLEALEKVSM